MGKIFTIWQIFNLSKKGLSNRGIAKNLGISRTTVIKYREMGLEESVKQVTQMSKRNKYSNPPMDEIKKILEREARTPATGIYDQLMENNIYSGSERTIQRLIKEIRGEYKVERKFEPVTGLKPGHQAQVDLGENRRVIFRDRSRRVYFITFVLSYGRLKYVEFYDVPINTFMFLNFHKKVFQFINGVPHEIVYDQTKLAVLKEKYGEIEFNKGFYRFANYYNFSPYICNKYDAPTKGKVENMVKYVKRNFLMGREFKDFNDLKERGKSWLSRRANGRICKATGFEPIVVFEKYEKDKLQELPTSGIQVEECYEKRNVNQVGLFSFGGKFYSIFEEYQCQDIKIFHTNDKIYVYDLDKNHIYTHDINRSRRRLIKKKEHYQNKNMPKKGPQTKELEEKLKKYIDEKLWDRFSCSIKKRFPRHYRDQLIGIIEISENYDSKVFREALQRAIYYHSISWGSISKICQALKNKDGKIPMVPLEVDLGMRIDVACENVEERKPSYYQEILFKKEELNGSKVSKFDGKSKKA